jgi:hypothetical protein
MYFQIKNETDHEPVIYPFNRSTNWRVSYRNQSTPRAIFYGNSRVWIQLYDVGCCFMTSVNQLRKNKDLLDLFVSLPSKGIDGALESISLNLMFTKKGVLCVAPVESLALHMQTEDEKDPYIDWESWWNSVKTYR